MWLQAAILGWSLRCGASVNLTAIDGHTALWWACAFDQSACAQILLNNGGKFGSTGLQKDELMRWSDAVKATITAHLQKVPPPQKKQAPAATSLPQNISLAAARGELSGRNLTAWAAPTDAPTPPAG